VQCHLPFIEEIARRLMGLGFQNLAALGESEPIQMVLVGFQGHGLSDA